MLMNLIHDLDCLRHICGEIVEVSAASSRAVREFEVEDTAAIVLQFANGALGTVAHLGRDRLAVELGGGHERQPGRRLVGAEQLPVHGDVGLARVPEPRHVAE